MLRIIAGKHKNRIIPTLRKAKYRPSTSKLKESIFSILTSGQFIENQLMSNNSCVLDLFSGTGNLGFEALSRGAGLVTLVDINQDYLKLAKQFASLIGEIGNMRFLSSDACNLPTSNYSYDVVFIDPPYYQNLASKALASLLKGNWLKNNAVMAVEIAKTDDIELPNNIKLIGSRLYGNSKLLILEHHE